MFYANDLLIAYLNATFLGGEIDKEVTAIRRYFVRGNSITIEYECNDMFTVYEKEVELLDVIGFCLK